MVAAVLLVAEDPSTIFGSPRFPCNSEGPVLRPLAVCATPVSLLLLHACPHHTSPAPAPGRSVLCDQERPSKGNDNARSRMQDSVIISWIEGRYRGNVLYCTVQYAWWRLGVSRLSVRLSLLACLVAALRMFTVFTMFRMFTVFTYIEAVVLYCSSAMRITVRIIGHGTYSFSQHPPP